MRRLSLITALVCVATPAAALVPCGGPFNAFKAALQAEAVAQGMEPDAAARLLAAAQQDPATLRADRAQGIFQLPFVEFARRVISQNRMDNGRANAQRHAAIFDRITQEYGVAPGILLAFWALETDFGAVQGTFTTIDSLVTLAHDCRRPELFQPQVLAAIELHARGGLPLDTTGAWAGEIGMVQMLPADILENGRDGDGDGRVRLKASPSDALLSGGAMLADLGWRANEPWMQEVTVPADFDWFETGLTHRRPAGEWAQLGVRPRSGSILRPDLPTALILPQGRSGPAFLVYPNFDVLFEWNQSFVYVTTAAYFATRLSGAPIFNAGPPVQALGEAEMKQLQERLVARGHDVGGVDGILGAKTRAAVQREQQRLGLPADAWPTPELLRALR